MTKKSGKHLYRVLGLMTVVSLFIVACGGSGGTSSGSGGGGGAAVARVSGTVTAGNARAELNIEQRVFDSTGAIVAISNFIIPPVQAQTLNVANIPVEVSCAEGGSYPGETGPSGRFVIDVPDIGTGICTVIVNGVSLDPITLNPGMETEIKVSVDGTTVNLLSIKQEPDDSPKITIKIDDDDNSDDDSSDDEDSDDKDGDKDGEDKDGDKDSDDKDDDKDGDKQ